MVSGEGEGGELDAIRTLVTFSELELQIARFYERLAEMFDDDAEVSEFWLRLSSEEVGHADALRSVADVLPVLLPEELTRKAFFEPRVVRNVRRSINACESLMARHEKSLDAALRCALFLESSELNDIYQWLLDKFPIVWSDTLTAMNEHPELHVLSLCEAVERHARDPELRQRAHWLCEQWEEYRMR